MPSQLQRRLARFLDASVAHQVNAVEGEPHNHNVAAPTPAELLDPAHKPPHNTHRHWLGLPFGQVTRNVQSIMIHGTSGWPSYASAGGFRERYECVDDWDWKDSVVPAHWGNDHAIGPQYFIDPNGTIFALIGPENLEGDARFTWHSNAMSFVALGIENSDGGDSGSIVPANHSQLFRITMAQATPPTSITGTLGGRTRCSASVTTGASRYCAASCSNITACRETSRCSRMRARNSTLQMPGCFASC